jgi:predicted nuclease of restriction endonuclease-like (RecB) superfamily
MAVISNDGYDRLLNQIGSTLTQGRGRAIQEVNSHLLQSYWQIGRHIVEFEQAGQAKAEYGAGLISHLAKDLTLRLGKGFSRSDLKAMRQFYLSYPKSQTLSGLLSWSHVVELLKVSDPLERGFYEKQMALERWGVRELKRQMKSGLFLRLAASKDSEGILKLASQGQIALQGEDLLREPYVFEFLKIPEGTLLSESDLESRLCNHLQQFLLELGKGFTFVGRQYRITINNTHYRVDLVFYHRILRRFVLIDLKIEDVEHHDIGQMDMYLGYFAAEENGEGDSEPIGIILSRHKDELLVEYATYGMNSQLFVQKYQLYLPNREELRRELERTLAIANEESRAKEEP